MTDCALLAIGRIEERLRGGPFAAQAEAWLAAAREAPALQHGDLPGWLAAVQRVPDTMAAAVALDQNAVSIMPDALSDAQYDALREALKALSPWRKGPFRVGELVLDSEWRCDMKWQRIAGHLGDLDGRRVLDIGGGNGYYAWRMLGDGAASVLNIDPTALFLAQFFAIDRLIRDRRVAMLPLALETLPAVTTFDSVFSMGVLYHRRDPLAHLKRAASLLRAGGELILETLVVPGDASTCLVPQDRYARMRNVWFLPSTAMLEIWLSRAGFANIRVVDVTATTTDEQRATDWMPFESLSHALDAEDPTRTIEGLPAPQRATLIAGKPAQRGFAATS